MKAIAVVTSVLSLLFVAEAATIQVDVVNFAYVPETLSVDLGDTVLWINQGTVIHTTTSGVNGVPDGLWDSGSMSPGDSFFFVFDTTGVFPYYCTPHWAIGMTGMIVVNPTGIDEFDFDVDDVIALGQNTPNPFKDKTRIGYQIRNTDYTESAYIEIYDVSGITVKRFDLQFHNGSSVVWDGMNEQGNVLPNGIYFYSLRTGNAVIQRKMVLMH